jgi:Holliday junction resolvase RusA-like endonuclease
MTFMVTFRVEGEPKGKGRPRFRSTGKFVQTYTDSKTRDYENTIKASAMIAMGASKPLESPVAVFIHATKGIPASYSKKRTEACLNGIERPSKKPDLDNIMKACLDAMNEVVYLDDKQVVSIHATQVYGTYPNVEVLVREELP